MTRKNNRGQGRKRTPTAIKIARGTDKPHRNERMNPHEPDAPTGIPPCPEHLGTEARAEWENICKLMAELGVLSPVYQRSLELYVRAYSNYRKAMDMVDKLGLSIVRRNKNGETEVVRNPFCTEAHKYHEECYRWLTEFGLTPSAKASVIGELKQKPTVSSRSRA